MPLQRTVDWLRDGFRAYVGKDASLTTTILMVVAIVVALGVAGIALGAYIVFIIAALALFLVLYFGYRGARYLYRRAMN